MLYCCGSNGQGQLGLGHRDDAHQWTPCDMPKPAKLSAGGNHTLIIDHNHRTFVTGAVGDHASTQFEQIPGEWLFCASGWDFYLLADATSVYFYGNHQLLSSPTLKLLHTFASPIKSLECGVTHAVIVLENACLYGFGLGRQGQLGHLDKAATFELLSHRGNQVACGRDYTLILYRDQLIALGKRVKALSGAATAVHSGWTFYGVERNDQIHWYGNDTFGQLQAPSTTTVAVGSEHGLAYLDGQVVAWGWGEHGNCPGPVTVNTWPLLYAGCATSWFWV